jgi:hypothetical protein
MLRISSPLRLAYVVCGIVFAASAGCAYAKEATVTVGAPELRGSFDSDPRSLSPADEAALRRALNIDPKTLETKSRPFGSDTASPRVNWSRKDGKDGAATVTVNQPLATEWDAKIGADVGLAPTPPTSVRADKPWETNTDNGTGAAWASIAVPNVAALDARVSPTQDQSALGATFKQTVPVGQDYAVTLQNRYGLVDTFSNNSALAGVTTPGRIYTTDRELKLNMLSSKTALAGGTTSSTADNVTRGRVSAEQNIYGPLNLTAGVSDIGAPVTNKSVKAGLKLNW